MSFTIPQALERLKRANAAGRLAHAYVLMGQPETVYAGLVRPWLTDLLQNDPEVHPDVRHLRPQGKRREIPVVAMRQLIGDLSQTAMLGGHKIGVIHGADRLNTSAANAFLRTLEEPGRRTLFLLLTERPQNLLPTITSRCLKVRLRELARPEPDDALVPLLQEGAAIQPGQLVEGMRWVNRLLTYFKTVRATIETEHADASSSGDLQGDGADENEKTENAAIETEYREKQVETLRFIIAELHKNMPHAVGVIDDAARALGTSVPEGFVFERLAVRLFGPESAVRQP
jgi:hypothetical protein